MEPSDFQFREGDFLAAWSDGGFDVVAGGTAAYVVSLFRDSKWQYLQMGGIYDATIRKNDSLCMEAIGMELLIGTKRIQPQITRKS